MRISKNFFTRILASSSQRWSWLLEKLRGFSRPERHFLYLILAASFLITGEATVTKAVSNSYFITQYGPGSLPLVWLATVPINLLVVFLYNRYITRIGYLKTLWITLSFCFTVHITLAFTLHLYAPLSFAFYIWKDIFIIFLFHKLWSMIHATMKLDKAKFLYGLVFAFGGLGSMLSSLLPGFLATSLGTEKLLLTTAPYFIFLFWVLKKAAKVRKEIEQSADIDFEKKERVDFSSGLSLIGRSKYLQCILILVLSIQVASTILDYQFNASLAKMITETDLRTEFFGRLSGFVNTLTTILQPLTTLVLIHLFGLKRMHLFFPTWLGLCMLFILFNPVFSAVLLSFVSIKVIDYSLFGVSKELLYLPLKVEEKFKAKALIDVFAYRSSKAIASLLVLLIEAFLLPQYNMALSIINLIIFTLWLWTAYRLFHIRKTLVTDQESLA